MLASFTIRRTFNRLNVSLRVEREHAEATLDVTYDRLLVRVGAPVPYMDAYSPELAEAWLSRPLGERGSFVEALEWQCRTGLLAPLETA